MQRLVLIAKGDVCSMHAGSLLKLTMNGNHLTAIAPECGQLTNLRELHLQGNQLTELPTQLYQLTVSLHIYGMICHTSDTIFLLRLKSQNMCVTCYMPNNSCKQHTACQKAGLELVNRPSCQGMFDAMYRGLRHNPLSGCHSDGSFHHRSAHQPCKAKMHTALKISPSTCVLLQYCFASVTTPTITFVCSTKGTTA